MTSGRSLANAMQRDIDRGFEQEVRRAASRSGTRLRKTSKGFEIEGDARKLSRFYNRLGS